MNILFWNLKKNSNEKWIVELLTEHDIDVAIFSEYSGTSFEFLLDSLGGNYTRYDGKGACEKVTLDM